MIHTILIGIVIGICVSAPVGPIGILCIQRTITRGPLHGIATGLGATTSDLLYAVLVGFSMSFIINFIESHQFLIQIFGSIIIFIFGLHLFRNKPTSQPNYTTKNFNKGDLFSDYISSFALCFSNPLIIFLFIGLFARFHVFDQNNPISQNAIGLISILIGATAWWGILTMLVSKLRNKFNIKGLIYLNKITGMILMTLSVIGIIIAIINL